jgi:GNAT superfamily N-acetyltransferase
MQLFRARPTDAVALSHLALAAKGVWGYDAAFLEQCRAELTVSPRDIETLIATVAAEDILSPAGFSLLDARSPAARLDMLYVHPDCQGRGIGGRLWRQALWDCAVAGAATLTWDADPHAVPFYLHVGARVVGEAPSGSIPGRRLPVMQIAIASPPNGPWIDEETGDHRLPSE